MLSDSVRQRTADDVEKDVDDLRRRVRAAMVSSWSARAKAPLTAAAKRAHAAYAGPLFAAVATREEELCNGHPERYALLAKMTIEELEALALQEK